MTVLLLTSIEAKLYFYFHCLSLHFSWYRKVISNCNSVGYLKNDKENGDV